jgi:endonuclease/exonuclease/phosphatase family metal-dependent hydrolase
MAPTPSRVTPRAARALLSRRARNYRDPRGPRFAGHHSRQPAGERHELLRLATFNIRFAREIGRALALLRRAPFLRGAHVLALQEMDEAGAAYLARELGYNFVYYPATVHPATGRNFGNAILARGTIERDHKVMLPHLGRTLQAQRIAVAATVRFGGWRVRVLNVHLGTPLEISQAARRRQVAALPIEEPEPADLLVVMGDLNAKRVGRVFERRGFLWLTKRVRRTIRLFAWDHVFLRGLKPGQWARTGVVRNNLGASDHKPVWAEVALGRHP